MISLIVKGGNPRLCHDAARLRKIYAKRINVTPHNECVLLVEDANLNKVAKWYAEESEKIDGYGFAPGTLLLYTILPND